MSLFAQLASDAGTPGESNEDYAAVGCDTAVVIDGLTARGDTGCVHGVAWYARHLGNKVIGHARLGPRAALEAAIQSVTDSHRNSCDLAHPGTPAAAVAVVQFCDKALHYAILGDVTLLLGMTNGVITISDLRIQHTAGSERAHADNYPTGSNEKAKALARMKLVELAARNAPGGYWVASADPAATKHALTGSVPLSNVQHAAILTDGAARLVSPFDVMDWPTLLTLLATGGAGALIRHVRSVEESDPLGLRWPRNKKSDDATVIYVIPSD